MLDVKLSQQQTTYRRVSNQIYQFKALKLYIVFGYIMVVWVCFNFDASHNY